MFKSSWPGARQRLKKKSDVYEISERGSAYESSRRERTGFGKRVGGLFKFLKPKRRIPEQEPHAHVPVDLLPEETPETSYENFNIRDIPDAGGYTPSVHAELLDQVAPLPRAMSVAPGRAAGRKSLNTVTELDFGYPNARGKERAREANEKYERQREAERASRERERERRRYEEELQRREPRPYDDKYQAARPDKERDRPKEREREKERQRVKESDRTRVTTRETERGMHDSGRRDDRDQRRREPYDDPRRPPRSSRDTRRTYHDRDGRRYYYDSHDRRYYYDDYDDYDDSRRGYRSRRSGRDRYYDRDRDYYRYRDERERERRGAPRDSTPDRASASTSTDDRRAHDPEGKRQGSDVRRSQSERDPGYRRGDRKHYDRDYYDRKEKDRRYSDDYYRRREKDEYYARKYSGHDRYTDDRYRGRHRDERDRRYEDDRRRRYEKDDRYRERPSGGRRGRDREATTSSSSSRPASPRDARTREGPRAPDILVHGEDGQVVEHVERHGSVRSRQTDSRRSRQMNAGEFGEEPDMAGVPGSVHHSMRHSLPPEAPSMNDYHEPGPPPEHDLHHEDAFGQPGGGEFDFGGPLPPRSEHGSRKSRHSQAPFGGGWGDPAPGGGEFGNEHVEEFEVPGEFGGHGGGYGSSGAPEEILPVPAPEERQQVMGNTAKSGKSAKSKKSRR